MNNGGTRRFDLSPRKRALLAALRGDRPGGDSVDRIGARAPEAGAPLSFAQEHLWITEQLQPGTAAYNIPSAIEIRGPLDAASLERALGAIVDRHEILRASIHTEDGKPRQTIAERLIVPLETEDLRGATDPEALGRQRAREEASLPFDLAVPPLVRARLLRVAEARHVLLLTLHHIVADGWSVQVLVRELGALYEAFSADRPSPLPPLALQYPDFAHWQRTRLDGAALDQHLTWWRERLAGRLPYLELPADRARTGRPSARGNAVHLLVESPLADRIRQLARELAATPSMVLLAAFEVLLSHYTGAVDMVLGSTISGRTRAEIEPLIGFFVDTLVLRTDLSGDPDMREVLRRVREATLGAYAHQDVPLGRLLATLQPERGDVERHPFFEILFDFQEAPVGRFQLGPLSLRPLPVENDTAKFDLTLEILDDRRAFRCSFELRTDLFDRPTMEILAARFQRVLEQVVTQPDRRLTAVALDDAHVLAGLRGPEPEQEEERGFVGAFEAQVRRTPATVAVRAGGRSLTYAELNARANRIAHALRGAGARGGGVVAVLLERNVALLCCLLGILKGGGAYLPIDPTLPPARIAQMLTQSGCLRVVTDRDHAGVLDEATRGSSAVHLVEDLERVGLDGDPGGPIPRRGLAYVIFTSGSTGAPKGAMVEHAGMLNHLRAKVRSLGYGPEEIVAQTATQSFDVSIWQLLSPLLTGGHTVIFRGSDAWEPRPLLRGLEDERVTVFETVPSHMDLILDELEANPIAYRLPALRWLILNGEALPMATCERWARLFPEVPVVNAYGPTECSDDITQLVVASPPDRARPWAALGAPLQGVRLHVLNTQLRPVPQGLPGELYVAGVAVGRGYIHDPVRTAEAFVPDLLSTPPGGRLYRTGDVVRHRLDGSFEFLGRLDQQIKIRGFRIETGEIETILREHPAVRQVVVHPRKDIGRTPRLVAYVVARPAVSAPDLLAHARAKLAPYMVPSAIAFLPELPLLPNGKVDKRALEAVSLTEEPTAGAVAPRTPTEAALLEIWAEALGTDRLGVEDSFFTSGGHSLLALQILSSASKRFGMALPLRTLFDAPTIGGMAATIDALRAAGGVEAPTGHTTELIRIAPQPTYELAPYQLPEWYLHELEPESPFYNICLGNVVLRGDLDLDAFARAWRLLVARHGALRTTFVVEDGRPRQRLAPPFEIRPEDLYIDLRHVPEEGFTAEVQRLAWEWSGLLLDFRGGPMFRVKLAELPGKRFLFIFLVHHILWDERSTMNLAGELSEIYSAYRSGREPRLPLLEIDYVDFAHWMNRALAEGHFARQRSYWLRTFATIPEPLRLPTDAPRPRLQTFNGTEISSHVPSEDVAPLEAFLREHEVTLYIFLLAVLNLQLHRITGQDDFVVGTPVANRNDPRVGPVMGLFATAVPMRCTIPGEMTFLELLTRTRQTAVEAYENHQYPSILAIQELNPEVDLSRNRLFSVMFGVQNNKTQLLSDLSFEGLEVSFVEGITLAEQETSKFDLSIIVDQLGSEIEVRFNYNTDLFRPATARRMHEQLLSLVRQVIVAPRRRLRDYDLLSSADRARLRDLNATDAPFAADVPMHHGLEARARQTPDLPAVQGADGETSYAELNDRANALARYLGLRGVQQGDLVVLALPRGTDLLVAMLAVSKIGAAYVPLDLAWPAERLVQVATVTRPRAIVTSGPSPCWPGAPFVIDLGAERELIAMNERHDLDVPSVGGMLAYLLFTSGTTGAPKGIAIERRGLANLLAWLQREYRLDPDDGVLWITSPAFDAVVLETLWPLTAGARIVLPPEGAARDPALLLRVAAAERVTVLQTVPTLLDELVRACEHEDAGPIPGLRLVVCGGAPLPRALRDRLHRLGDARFVNHYGPTEVTVDATSFDAAEPFDGGVVPIGRPLANVRVHVLDRWMAPVPPGTVGEIWVASPGLARGYFDDPARTADQFRPDPFCAGGRLYRTGDLGKFSHDGALYYRGRRDRQVKLRGNRVELEEIEARLLHHPDVAQAVVRVSQRDETTRLCAFLVPSARMDLPGPDGSSYRLFTLAQRPDRREDLDRLHLRVWPEYFSGDGVTKSLWPRFYAEFPHLQFILVDSEDRLVAGGNMLPLYWNGLVEGLPRGWDAAVVGAFEDHARGTAPSTLIGLTGVVSPDHGGRGLGSLIVDAFKSLAHESRLRSVLLPVRPIGKLVDPETSIAAWVARRRADGTFEDHWLRVHHLAGGTILRPEERSQRVTAPIADWEQWAGRLFPSSGAYVVPNALQPLQIDRERGVGEYWDPCVWVEHRLFVDTAYPWRHLDGPAVRGFLRGSLPDYMIPDTVMFLPALPRLSSGKIDERALLPPDQAIARAHRAPPATPLQHEVAAIWREVLEIEQISVDESFFEAGGHSIRAARMLAKLADRLGVSTIPLRQFFLEPTIYGLERLVREASSRAR